MYRDIWPTFESLYLKPF